MADAGLVERIDWTRYRATPSGLELATQLPLEAEHQSGIQQEQHEQPGYQQVDGTPSNGDVSTICADLRTFSRMSDASEDFERTIARAFEYFGFKAEHLGGAGKTDVLVTAELSATDRFRSIIDAKASATGIITDNAVKFDALKDHQRKHEAQYGLVIGPDFATRVMEWAANNKIALLTVEELVGLLERHQRAPLALPELRSLFEHSESDLSELEDRYDQEDHKLAVIARLVEMLLEEANEEDPVANGFISRENLHYVLRKEMSPRPLKAEIDDMLGILSSKLVRGVEQSGERFKLIDSPANVSSRFRTLGSRLIGDGPN